MLRLSRLVALSAALALPGSVFAQSSPSPDAARPAPDIEGARRAFLAGVNLMTDPDGAKYGDALVQFRHAERLGAGWKVYGNIGICAMKLERVGEAIDAYERYLAMGGSDITPDERVQVQRDVDTLKAQTAVVELEFPAGGVRITDQRRTLQGATISNDYTFATTRVALRLTAGSHYIVAFLPRGKEGIDIELKPGEVAVHKFGRNITETPPGPPAVPVPKASTAPGEGPTPSPPSATGSGEAPAGDSGPTSGERPIPTSVYVAGGATAVFTLGAIVTAILASGAQSDYEAVNGQPGHTRSELQGLHDDAASMATINTVLTGVAIVGAGVTAVLYLTRPEEGGSSAALLQEPHRRRQRGLWLGVGATPGGGLGLGLGGSL